MTGDKIVIVALNHDHAEDWRHEEQRRRGEPIGRLNMLVVTDLESAQRVRGSILREDQVVWYSWPWRNGREIEAIVRSRIRA